MTNSTAKLWCQVPDEDANGVRRDGADRALGCDCADRGEECGQCMEDRDAERARLNRGFGEDVPALAEVTSAFLRVRSGHDYGYGHGDFAMSDRAGAVARAKELIRPLIYTPGEVSSWVNYSIEERWVIRYIDGEAMGDRVASGTERSVGSTKVVLTDSEKAAKLAEPENAAKFGAAA